MQNNQATILEAMKQTIAQCQPELMMISDAEQERVKNFYLKRLNELNVDDVPGFTKERFARFCQQYYHNDSKRGLLFFGNVGTGKTFRVEILKQLFKLDCYPASQLVRAYEVDEYCWESLIKPNFPKWNDLKGFDIIIDDIGAEIKSVNYGKHTEVIKETIRERHDLFKQKNVKTFFSTNLDEEALKDRYDDRIWSRLQEMCTFIHIGGKDRRAVV